MKCDEAGALQVGSRSFLLCSPRILRHSKPKGVADTRPPFCGPSHCSERDPSPRAGLVGYAAIYGAHDVPWEEGSIWCSRREVPKRLFDSLGGGTHPNFLRASAGARACHLASSKVAKQKHKLPLPYGQNGSITTSKWAHDGREHSNFFGTWANFVLHQVFVVILSGCSHDPLPRLN